MYYFVSDIHLGTGDLKTRIATEHKFVEWLERVSQDAKTIFLCGDIFDFWYEYSEVVPRGFVRTLAKIAELTERGIRVVFMAGNHDMWVSDYLRSECGAEIYTKPQIFELGVKRVHVAHGDNLNIKGNVMLKLMNGFFRSRVIRFLFTWLVHPNIALKFGHWWSRSSRKGHGGEPVEQKLRGVGYLREYAMNDFASSGADTYIFGHIHHAEAFVEEQPQIYFMNDWSSDPHYVAMNESGEVSLCRVNN